MMEPEKLGPFTIGRLLGRGGMGAVYEGISERDGSRVALKVLTTSFGNSAEDRCRFEAEIDTLKRLHHPNIVRLTGFGEEQGQLYYVMELVDGSSLRQELQQKRIFQWHEAAQIGLEIGQALRHAHDRGVIHRDIKPANILLDSKGNIKLSDFGIARFFGAQPITETHSIVGTLEYMSPEQACAETVTAVSDLYSLGCVLYALLTSKPPFLAKTLPELLRQHRDTLPIWVNRLREDVPDELADIIADLLHLRPDDRPRNALLVIKRLQSLVQPPFVQPLAQKRADLNVSRMPMLPETPDFREAETNVAETNATGDSERALDSERIDLLADTVASTSVLQRERENLSSLPTVTDSDAPSPAAVRHSETADSPSKSATHFTAVANTGSVPFEEEERSRPVLSFPTILASVTLLIAGLLVYYLLQPVPAEVLFARITAKVRESVRGGYALTQLRSAQNDIRQFLSMYPHHPSADQVRSFQDELDLQDHERRLERRMHYSATRALSPVERIYVEILTASPHHPEQTIDKLQAFIAVFQTAPSLAAESATPYRFTSSPVDICVELARRRLKKLEQEAAESFEEQKQVLRGRLDEAADWDSKDRSRAEAVRRGIVELYQHHRWAKELVEEAEELLRE